MATIACSTNVVSLPTPAERQKKEDRTAIDGLERTPELLIVMMLFAQLDQASRRKVAAGIIDAHAYSPCDAGRKAVAIARALSK